MIKNNRTERRNSRFFTVSSLRRELQSPHCVANYNLLTASRTTISSLRRELQSPHCVANYNLLTASRTTISSLRRELQSPHCVANCLQHVCSSDPGPIVCNARANTPSAYHVQPAVCHVVRRDSSAIHFDRANILALFYWLKPLTNEGWVETGVPGENSRRQASENATH